MKSFEFLEHTADVKMKVYGKSLQELFINSAKGMAVVIYGEEILYCKTDKTETITVKSDDRQSLLVDWLSELLFLSHTNYRVYINFEIKRFSDTKIVAGVKSCNAKAKEDVKAVTYSELVIQEKEDGWEAVVVFDI